MAFGILLITLALRPQGLFERYQMRGLVFWAAIVGIFLAGVASTKLFETAFFFFAGYAILQATIMAVAWNILGGFTGYVNFGSAGFFAIGAYTSVALSKAIDPPLIVPLLVAALLGGLVGLGTGYLTLRLRGVYFAIATLAMAIVFETFVNNWAYVGGATGAYILTPQTVLFFDNYVEFLFRADPLLGADGHRARAPSQDLAPRPGAGRDPRRRARGGMRSVPTLRLKLLSTTAMGALGSDRRSAVSVLRHLCRPALRVQPDDRGQRHRDADDRRHRDLVWPGGRRPPARLDPGDRHGHDLVRGQRPDRRRPSGGLHHGGAAGHRRAAPGPLAEGAPPWLNASMAEPILEVQGPSKRFGGFVALDGVSLHAGEGERVRPDRPERLGQDHHDQLHRRPALRRRRRDLPGPERDAPARRTGAYAWASPATSRSRARSGACRCSRTS